MVDGRVITVHIGELNREIFQYNPVWCEYYEPNEIDELIALGEDPIFLNNEIIQKNEESGGQIHPYYSLPSESKLQREFLFIKAFFYIFNKKFSGYACLIKDQINTISIFDQSNIVDLYLNEDFREDNYNTICKLTGQIYTSNFDIMYELQCGDDVYTKKGVIMMPCSCKP